MSDAWDLDALVERWRGPLVGWLRARGRRASEAVELAQDVFAEAWLGRERFAGDARDERAVGAWLRGIARNLDRARRRADARRAEGGPEELDAVASPDTSDDPTDAAEDAQRLRDAIDRLPKAERIVVRAFYLEESDAKTVAALLGRSERAVEGVLYRARRRLAGLLAADRAPR